MSVDPAAKAVQLLDHLNKLEVQERLKRAQYLEQQETFRLARLILTQGLRRFFGLRAH